MQVGRIDIERLDAGRLDPVAGRILDAALQQFTRSGLRRSTVDDVARRAKVSRVTVYRRFGSKEGLVAFCLLRESRRFLAVLDAAVAELPSIEERVAEGFAVTLRHIRSHPLMGGLLRLEPDVVLPFLTVDGGPVLVAVRDHVAERLRREGVGGAGNGGAGGAGGAGGSEAAAVAELMVRVVVSFLLTPASCIELDDADRARDFARRFLVPLLRRH
ncbi:TetR family transcriptional regulator [Kitasatospora sp. NPDC056138]|uniref:TetR family transcriptional regulator n=1 Tax=Kitasatospora sp. NPDC056138 TaxID=3345724 RepID=UPI0035DEB003